MEAVSFTNVGAGQSIHSTEERREETLMAYVFEPEKYQVVDEVRGLTIKSVRTVLGWDGRRIMRFISSDADFCFYAKIINCHPDVEGGIGDHWSLDGIPRDSGMPPAAIQIPKPVADAAFAEITQALGEFRISRGNIVREGVAIKRIAYDL